MGGRITLIGNNERFDYYFKLLLLGEAGVGKTSLMVQYIDSQFNVNYTSSIGVNWMSKEVLTKWGSTKLILWDVAGQSKHTSYRNLYYKGAGHIIFVFDITSRDSFTKLKVWIDDTLALFNNGIGFTIIGNKLDLEPQRAVNMGDYNKLFSKYTANMLLFFETSAKTGENVDEAFQKITEGLVEKCNSAIQHQSIPESSQ